MKRAFAIRRRIVVACCLVALVSIAGAIVITRRADSAPALAKPTISASAGIPTSVPTPVPSSSGAPVRELADTADPDAYASAIAARLFGVDFATTTRDQLLKFWRSEAATVVYSDAARQGLTLDVQTADMLDNLDKYFLAAAGTWATLAADRTVESLLITSVTTPAYFVDAIAAGQITDPGVQMRTVLGVLTTRYGAGQRSTRSVSVDLALLCPPTESGSCRLIAPQPPAGV